MNGLLGDGTMFRGVLALAFAGVLTFGSAGARAAPPIEAYGKLPALEKVSLSPAGERIAMITVIGEARRLVIETVDGKVKLTANLGAIKVRGVSWAGEDHILVTTSSTVDLGMGFNVDRQELSGVVAINIAAGKLTQIFPRGGAIASTVDGEYGAREIGGKWYGYFGGVTLELSKTASYDLTHTYPDLYRVNLDTGVAERVASGSEDSDGWLVGPDGTVIARATYDQRRGDWKILHGAFGGPQLASGNNPYGGVALLGLGRTPGTLLVDIPKAHATSDQEIPLAGGPATVVPDDSDIATPLFDRRTGAWIGYVGFGDVPEQKMFDPAVDVHVRATLKAFPGRSVRFDSWSDDFSWMVVFTSGGDDSGTYWLVNIAKRAADPIGQEYPDVHPADVGPIRMVDWKAADGLELHGVLSLPPGRSAHDLPLVVMPHGGPWARDYPVFDWWAQAFASQGYAVFQPNYRGSTELGAKLYEAGLGEYGHKMQTDISDGVAELARQGIIDPKRTCVVGASYGGYSALMGVTILHTAYRCSVSVAGLSNIGDFNTYIGDKGGEESGGQRDFRAFVGPGDLNQISPVNFAKDASAPILLIYGKDDTQVPIEQTQLMQRALLAAGKSVQLVTLPHEDHFLSREDTRIITVKASVAFVEKYNPPDPAPPAAVAAK
jgi:dienelactone hydrolase